MTDRRALGLLTLLLLVLTLPFVSRAYFVDDYYFVTMAKGILEHPLRPYDFVSDDAGIKNVAWERGQQPRMVNPPLFHYFLAAVIAVWGDATWKLRSASLIFSLISLFAVYFIGKRFVRNPFAAAALLALTPAFWLTSYSLLIDSALLAFVVTALWSFIEGQERKHMGWMLLSGGLMGLALVTKYTGFLVIPLVLAWHGFYRDRCSWQKTAVALGMCGGIFLLWGIWGILTYGQMHFTATFSRGFHPAARAGFNVAWLVLGLAALGSLLRWKLKSHRISVITSWLCWGGALFLMQRELLLSGSLAGWLGTFYLDKLISVASFFSGCTVFLFFTLVLLWNRSKQNVVILAAGSVLLFLLFSSKYGGFNSIQSAMLAFFIGCTGAYLVLLIGERSVKMGPSVRFLSVWVFLGWMELVFVMPWTAARYLLIVLPPVVWGFQRWLENSPDRMLGRVAWGFTALMGGALACVDFAQAGVIKPLSHVLQTDQAVFQSAAPKPAHRWFYLADTFDGSQPYVEQLGWENVFPYQDFPKGSLFLRSVYRKSSWWKVSNPERFQLLKVWEFKHWIPLRVMDVPASAGFYASCWGSLPYVITRHPLERFELFVVKQ